MFVHDRHDSPGRYRNRPADLDVVTTLAGDHERPGKTAALQQRLDVQDNPSPQDSPLDRTDHRGRRPLLEGAKPGIGAIGRIWGSSTGRAADLALGVEEDEILVLAEQIAKACEHGIALFEGSRSHRRVKGELRQALEDQCVILPDLRLESPGGDTRCRIPRSPGILDVTPPLQEQKSGERQSHRDRKQQES